MSSSTLSVGIIGTGAFAAVHAQALQTSDTAKLSACFDRNIGTSTDFAKKWGGKAVKSIEDLLELKLDIILIASPDETHASIALTILKSTDAPKIIIVEKPLCINRAELAELETALKKSSVKIVVEHSRRFNRGFERLRDMIQSNQLGTDVLSVRFRYYAGWFHVGVHAVDTLRMLLGELEVVNATMKGVDRYPDDPLLDVELRSKKYPHAQIHLEGIPEKHFKVFDLVLVQDKGRIRTVWYDIFIDRPQEDDAFAPLLVFKEHFKADDIFTALHRLYGMSSDYIKRGDETLLSLSGFEAARGTMDILFDATEKAHA